MVHPTALAEPHIDRLAAAILDGGRRSCFLAAVTCLPRWYGQKPHPTLYGVDETQDAFDIALARWAIRTRFRCSRSVGETSWSMWRSAAHSFRT